MGEKGNGSLEPNHPTRPFPVSVIIMICCVITVYDVVSYFVRVVRCFRLFVSIVYLSVHR